MTPQRTTPKKRIAILISGRGSNMEALVQSSRQETFPAEIVGVIANEPKAGGINLARKFGLPVSIIEHRDFDSRSAFERKLHDQLRQWDIELICLAGFMRIISPFLIGKWKDKILNIHPSMLPKYPGLNVHEQVYHAGEQTSGCTVHYVREKVDYGPGIVQARVPVGDCKSPQQIAERVLHYEHLIYPLAVRLFCGGQIEVVDEMVHFKGNSEATSRISDGGYNPLIVVDASFKSLFVERSRSAKESLGGFSAKIEFDHLESLASPSAA